MPLLLPTRLCPRGKRQLGNGLIFPTYLNIFHGSLSCQCLRGFFFKLAVVVAALSTDLVDCFSLQSLFGEQDILDYLR